MLEFRRPVTLAGRQPRPFDPLLTPLRLACLPGLDIRQALSAVLGKRSPMFDLFEGLAKLGAEIVSFRLDLEEQHSALVAFCQDGCLPVIRTGVVPERERFRSRHGLAVRDLLVIEPAAASSSNSSVIENESVICRLTVVCTRSPRWRSSSHRSRTTGRSPSWCLRRPPP